MRRANREEPWVQRALIGGAVALLALLVVGPLVTVFAEALSRGPAQYLRALADADTRAALRLTFEVALIAVPLNAVFGAAAAWLVTRHRLQGKGALLAVADLPFSVPPVIAGLIYVLLFGRQGLLGPWLDAHGLRVVFAPPAIVLATIFVTFPLVLRETLPVMESLGVAEEEAALTLGASGLRTFFTVTLPKVQWGLLQGVVLCTARAMGEFGAVSVVSGHIRGVTNTLPLQIESLYDDFDFVGAFAAASLLVLVGVASIAVRRWIADREVAS